MPVNCKYFLMLVPGGISAAGFLLESPLLWLFAIACILVLSTILSEGQENVIVFLMGFLSFPWMVFNLSGMLVVTLFPAPCSLFPELHILLRIALVMVVVMSICQVILGLLTRLIFPQRPIMLYSEEVDEEFDESENTDDNKTPHLLFSIPYCLTNGGGSSNKPGSLSLL